jgi:hypothetical protein
MARTHLEPTKSWPSRQLEALSNYTQKPRNPPHSTFLQPILDLGIPLNNPEFPFPRPLKQIAQFIEPLLGLRAPSTVNLKHSFGCSNIPGCEQANSGHSLRRLLLQRLDSCWYGNGTHDTLSGGSGGVQRSGKLLANVTEIRRVERRHKVGKREKKRRKERRKEKKVRRRKKEKTKNRSLLDYCVVQR